MQCVEALCSCLRKSKIITIIINVIIIIIIVIICVMIIIYYRKYDDDGREEWRWGVQIVQGLRRIRHWHRWTFESGRPVGTRTSDTLRARSCGPFYNIIFFVSCGAPVSIEPFRVSINHVTIQVRHTSDHPKVSIKKKKTKKKNHTENHPWPFCLID